MSMFRATETFHHEGGTEVGGSLRSGDDPLVQAFPLFFEEIGGSGQPSVEAIADAVAEATANPGRTVTVAGGPVKRGPGRPPGSKNKPKTEATEGGDSGEG